MVRPPSVVSPDLSGPTGPPRLICITVSGTLFSAPNHHGGTNTNTRTTAIWAMAEAPSIELSPSRLSARALKTSLTASISQAANSRIAGSLRSPLLGDDANLLDARFLQPPEYVHQLLE